MPRFFHGQTIGTVSALPQSSFAALCEEVLTQPVQLKITREAFHALPKRDKTGGPDQNKAKMVRFVTSCTFKTSPSHRSSEFAGDIVLLCLDVDVATEAKGILEQGFSILGDRAFIAWHTASSTPEKPRIRIVMPCEPLPVTRHAAAVQSLASMFGLVANTESMVAVQPMYLPTIFAGETGSPIIASNPDGVLFLAMDVTDEDGHAIVPVDTSGVVGDLDHLRAPIPDITPKDAGPPLAAIPADIEMKRWVEIGMGLKHQFGDQQGFELWNEWSSKGTKYDGREELEVRWASFKVNTPNRAPVTLRTVFKYAQDAGWKNDSLVRKAMGDLEKWIKSETRATEELLDNGATRIAQVATLLTPLQRKSAITALRETLFKRGQAFTVPDLRKEVHRLEVEATRHAGIAPWCRHTCFITSGRGGGFFYRYLVGRKFSPEVFDLIHQTEEAGDEKIVRPRDYAIKVAKVEQVEALRYEPRHTGKRFFFEAGVPYVNTYRPTYAKAEEEDSAECGRLYWQHQLNLVGSEKEARTLMDWEAFLVQHPGIKIRWAPLLQSTKGAGKTLKAEVFKVVLGRNNVRKLSGSHVLERQYNDWAYGSQLVVMEEVRVVGHSRYEVMDKLKPCITDDDFSLNQKFEDLRDVPNITNYMMFTNYQDSLAIQNDERRYFVIKSPLQTREDVAALGGPAYFAPLFDMVKNKGGGLRHFFENWKISADFNPNLAPITEAFYELVENAASPLAAAVMQALAEKNHALVRPDLLSVKALREQIGIMPGVSEYSDQTLASVLRELGWTKRARYMAEGDRHTLWTHGNKIKDPVQMAALRLEFL